MTWKAVGIIFIVIAFLAFLGAVGYKIIQKTEGYKAEEQIFISPTFTTSPLSIGCNSFKAEGLRQDKKSAANKTK